MVLFPGLVPLALSEPQPEAITISETGRRNRRTRTPLLDLRGLNARGNEARDVCASVESARVPARLDHQSRRARGERTVEAGALLSRGLLVVGEVPAEQLAQIRPPRSLPGNGEDLPGRGGVLADLRSCGRGHLVHGEAISGGDMEGGLEVFPIAGHGGEVSAERREARRREREHAQPETGEAGTPDAAARERCGQHAVRGSHGALTSEVARHKTQESLLASGVRRNCPTDPL